MIKPALQDDDFLADVSGARGDFEHFHLWWLGQSGFLLQWQGKHLLFDPYLSDALTKKYANTDQPHVRMTEQVIARECANERTPDARMACAQGVQFEASETATNAKRGADETIRPGTKAEKLATLKTSFRADGRITAGNSSQISDGAAALLLMSADAVKRFGVKPRARIRAFANVGSDKGACRSLLPFPRTRRTLRWLSTSLTCTATPSLMRKPHA